ncbi:MAG: hypothetical protein EOO77_44310 [Oxalobacteraceae bacterium]|nr:MAG: hypothetical protein EOO77_44310 [Oxalobacteraceae bacterium]
MADDRSRVATARRILIDREDRYRLFPGDIFDEYAWTMLLHLFVAFGTGVSLTERKLIHLVNTSINTGQRWLYQLAKDGQIESRRSGEDVNLTGEAINRLRQYLDSVHVH